MHVAKKHAWLGGVVIAGSVAWTSLAGAGPDAGARQGAVAQMPGLSISPANPAPGDTITVSSVCFGTDPETDQKVVGDRVDVFLVDHELDDVTDAYNDFVQKTAATPAADTTWSANLQIPVDATTDQVFFVVTQCLHRFSGFYQSGSFGVGLPQATTSTTAPTAGSGGTPASTDSAPTNPPGATAPVASGRPGFTG